jgi:hypothetical protein
MHAWLAIQEEDRWRKSVLIFVSGNLLQVYIFKRDGNQSIESVLCFLFSLLLFSV